MGCSECSNGLSALLSFDRACTRSETRLLQAWQACTEIRNAMHLLAQNPRDPSIFQRLINHSLEQLLFSYTNTYGKVHGRDTVDRLKMLDYGVWIAVSGGTGLDLDWTRRLRELFITVCKVICTQIPQQELSRK